MKMTAVLFSVAGMLIITTRCVCDAESRYHIRAPISPPLQNRETYLAVQLVARHAQKYESENDTSVRLMPRVDTSQPQLKICCFHGNILDVYLKRILHQKDQYPRMHLLIADLTRINHDLKKHCMSHNRHLIVQFREKLVEMGDGGINKAIGEMDILYTYLQDFCVNA
ncbi:interleukin-22 [Aplochiton taeniatus]